MAKETSQFTIKDKDLAEALEISLDKLYDIVDFFDKDSTDKWELKENDHFIYLSKSKGTRSFSQIGAFAIAKYMDSIEKKTLWDKLKEFVTRHKEKIRNSFVRQRVHEHCSSLTRKGGFYLLSKKDVVSILCTSYARLNQAFDKLKREGELQIGKHFDDIDNVRYYSFAGIEKISRELSQSLTRQDRRDWCSTVQVVGNKTLKQIASAEEQRNKRIEVAMAAAKNRDKCCQITGLKPKPANNIELAAHHIFSKSHYPHLAESLDNLITLTTEVHKEFHYWNGGFDKPCTVSDLIRFVNERYSDDDKYPNVEKLHLRLNQIRQMFGSQKIG